MAFGESTAHGNGGENSHSWSANDHRQSYASAKNSSTSQPDDAHIIDHHDEELPKQPVGAWGGIGKRIRRTVFRQEVALITTASYSPTENRRKREKQYMWIQGVRIPFLLLSALTYLWLENPWLSAVLFIVSVPLPWIAVVIANGIGEPRDPRAPTIYKPALARAQQENAHQIASQPHHPALPQTQQSDDSQTP